MEITDFLEVVILCLSLLIVIPIQSGYKKGLDEGMEIVLKELKERYNHE